MMNKNYNVSPKGENTVEQLFNNQLWLSGKDAVDSFGLVLDSKIKTSARVQKTVKFGKIPGYRIISTVTDILNHGIGVGMGKSTNRLGAKTKSFNAGKKDLQFLQLGCGSLECTRGCTQKHSLTRHAIGRCGSTIAHLIPAELGRGIVASPRIAEILKQIGIQDLRCKLRGSSNPMNCVGAVRAALSDYIKS
jgi:ribosomal protein S5